MEIAELSAVKREVVGKETSKKLRRKGRIPAVIYSNGKASEIAVNAREFSALAHSKAGTHVIVKLNIEGAKEHPNAIIKEVQKNPIRDEYLHIDFQEIALSEKISTTVPIAIVGEAPGVKAGGILEHHLGGVELEGLPKDMPANIEVDVSKLDIGESIHAKDLNIPPGIEMLTDPDAVVVAITASQAARIETGAVEEIAPEAVEGGAGVSASEGK
ncbi:MAG: 50S ribosomal protein L25 [Actinomycetota bacterium]|nr:50S ribosomal protein L25 [Actinomycetota bacterium]